MYILFKISVICIKNLALFTKNWKFSSMCILNFVEFLLFFLNFLKFSPQFIRSALDFPEYFLKMFTLKICLNIAWKSYICTTNVLRISHKFFRNFQTDHKISSKCLEHSFYLFFFFCKSFSNIFRTFPNNPAAIFKAPFKLYLQNFSINPLICWKFY